MIGKLGLFSSNETKEDINTNNLKYLLVPYYLAELTEKILQDDRIPVVKASLAKLKEFYSFCEAMELVPEEELEASSRGGSAPPADRRALKIARFKRQKAAESKLLEIKERKERRGCSTKAATLSTPVEDEEEDIPDDDSEEEREAWLSTLSLAVCKAIDLMDMLKREEEMLSAIKEKQLKNGEDGFSRDALDDRTKKAETWHRDAAARVQYSRPAQPITCATFAQDVLEGRASVSQGHEHKHQPLIFGPASLVNGALSTERERMIAQVFQPSHRMPTMSIEDAGLTEMTIMNEWQEQTKKAIEEASTSWYSDKPLMKKEEDDEDEDENAVMKARAFDDWKDDNPRGADIDQFVSNEGMQSQFLCVKYPEWPQDFDPFQKYHLMNESELEETDIIRLYLDLIFVSCNRSIHNPDLSALKIVKVAIETEEEEPASETLKTAT